LTVPEPWGSGEVVLEGAGAAVVGAPVDGIAVELDFFVLEPHPATARITDTPAAVAARTPR
jgi:hypothetical protein